MGQHTREHMMMPSRVFAHFIVIHTEFGFRLLKTLFNGPPDPTEPHQETQGRTQRRVTEIVPIPRMGTRRRCSAVYRSPPPAWCAVLLDRYMCAAWWQVAGANTACRPASRRTR